MTVKMLGNHRGNRFDRSFKPLSSATIQLYNSDIIIPAFHANHRHILHTVRASLGDVERCSTWNSSGVGADSWCLAAKQEDDGVKNPRCL